VVIAIPAHVPAMAMVALVGAHPAAFRKASMPAVSTSILLASVPSAIIGSVRNEANVEKLLADVKNSLKEVTDGVKQTAEEALRQAKQSGTVSEDVKQKADKLLTDQAKLAEAQQKLETRVEQLSTRNTDLEQQLAGRRGDQADDTKSLGQMVGERAEIKQFAERGAKGTVSVSVQNAITTSAGSAGAMATPQRDTEIASLPARSRLH
jgi:predicted nuclease with TOPRIM domain